MSKITVVVLRRQKGSAETRPCPGCSAAMRLVGVEAHQLPSSNDDIYTFECGTCGMTTAEVVSKGNAGRKSGTLVSSFD